jgi:protein transport protein SEC61 subunit gamma-like protein
MDHIQAIVDPSKQFMKDSLRLVKRCTKPDRKGWINLLFEYNLLLDISKFDKN